MGGAPKTVVVCGATGQQGSAVVAALQARGRFRVVALSRDPAGEGGERLHASGVEVERGDLDDGASLRHAFAGAHAVFGVTQPWNRDYRRADPEAEVAQGANLIEACRSAGVAHLVLSTALDLADRPTGIPHVDSKRRIERELSASGVPYTLLRPGTFMDNLGKPFFPVRRGLVVGFVGGDAKVPLIACRDIGEAAAAAVDAPGRWLGKPIDLVADFVSGDELCQALSRLRGERFEYRARPAWLMRLLSPEFYRMRGGIEIVGRPPFPFRARIDAALLATRELAPGAWRIDEYLERSGWPAARL
jgi:uncharacterized protein YbjT (DUF2867 family)